MNRLIKIARCPAGLSRFGFCATLAVCLLALTSCAEEVTYAYFAVQVSIDPVSVDDDLRKTIASCTLVVEGDDEDFDALPCVFNQVPYNLGVAEFSTSKKRGQLVFVAIMRNLNSEVVAQGSSPPVGIVPNLSVPTPTSVVAYAVRPGAPDAGNNDTAAPTPPAPDAEATDVAAPGDAAAPNDAAIDAL